MTDLQALLTAIRDDPGDETLRLAYSDVLEESGNVGGAEYVRLAVRERVVGTAWRGTSKAGWWYHRAGRRDSKVHVRGEAGLVRNLLPGKKNWGIQTSVVLRLGLVEAVKCTAADWCREYEEFTLLHPVREVFIVDWRELGRRLDYPTGSHYLSFSEDPLRREVPATEILNDPEYASEGVYFLLFRKLYPGVRPVRKWSGDEL